MATRWGAGEETLTACNMDFFSLNTLADTTELTSEESLEALNSCLDSTSILSLFDENPSIESKSLDDESEATLLTALTEILDNVDDENLSPFDTLPDSDLLSGQKGREVSPLRRLLCLSRSPQEKESPFSSRPLPGKSISRKQNSVQRSDGEEEDDGSLTASPLRQESPLAHNDLEWDELTLPLSINLDQENFDGLSLNLGDIVRHMHPYCMTICLEDDEGEQMLPEGGILLEVVDQGENGEPIVAIPDLNLHIAPSLEDSCSTNEQKISEEEDSSEHIVVDDEEDDFLLEVSEKRGTTIDEMVSEGKREEVKGKRHSHRKKKKKSKKESNSGKVEKRVLRSSSGKPVQKVLPEKLEKTPVLTEEKVETATISSLKLEKSSGAPTGTLSETQIKRVSSMSKRKDSVSCAPVPERACTLAAVVPSEMQRDNDPRQRESNVMAAASVKSTVVQSESAAEPVAPVPPEPKPKSLSLAEYRQLRQQKKPVPVEKQEDHSTKWPKLPELPRELPPIPCLPDPSPKGPQAAKKDLDEIKPAWQPRGPGAPPTPEALLAPPAYMASSNKVSSTTVSKPQQRMDPEIRLTPKSASIQNNSATEPSLEKVHATSQLTTSTKLSDPTSHASPSPKDPPLLVPARDIKGASCSENGVKIVPRAVPVFTKPVETSQTSTAASASLTPLNVSEVTAAKSTSELCGSSPLNNAPAQPSTTCPAPSVVSPIERAQSALSEKKAKPISVPVKAQNRKDPTQELIESFTTEIGIEAADLTSLLEQFEETQAKEEKCVPEVSGRAAAVGNSRDAVVVRTAAERVKASDVASTAALTPPATPPHQMWKPLVPVTLLGKDRTSESSKSKVIQIEARPLPGSRFKLKTPAAPAVSPAVACQDHDYCLPDKELSSALEEKRWNVKRQTSITIKAIKEPNVEASHTPRSPLQSAANTRAMTKEPSRSEPLDHRTDEPESSSVLETPDASPVRQENMAPELKSNSQRRGPCGRSYRWHTASRSPSPIERSVGHSRKRPQHSSSPVVSDSDSDSSRSRSRSPARKRYRSHSSRSSSSSSSRSSSRSCSPPRRRRYSYSSSRSGSWSRSRSRSRSRSPQRRTQWNRGRRNYSPSYRSGYGCNVKPNAEEVKRRKEKAIEERRVVYIGGIRGTMTQRELRDRFSYFGEVEECTLHFRDQGDNYGFVTYYKTNDAFDAIENGNKLRKADELPFDLCFGGRRQFCKSTYADLDSCREYDPLPGKAKNNALDFDTLLKQAQQNLKR
ncbi:peroxisome proliferator-activated receptor gamma coactivator-related protein 1 isoform X1 [Synchiropus splendidus]|uniref:peroxisome proliferator-activated receptor gamma coactivator-related protein 1 isoform X1 n=1 Tax=Synchiropus splendidus TaxID=270530 RepID=UPI00237EE19B|nr:peroxisome proliferator-activated receptor gamma coactivator-related protein 1 isoform X1 [Synchiropus splendidus]